MDASALVSEVIGQLNLDLISPIGLLVSDQSLLNGEEVNVPLSLGLDIVR